MNRTEYLQKFWTPYPAIPKDTVLAGRIFALDRTCGLTLKILRDQRIHTHTWSRAPEHSVFLTEGDLVAITSGDECLLLAPQLKSPPPLFINKEILQEWSDYLDCIRSFFKRREFLELKTPSLVTCPGTEPSLDVFSTLLVHGSFRQKLYLPTSPELHLKKALAMGAEKIFELAPCYRNGELTDRHQPEFLMLEWYRAYDSLETIKKDVVGLIYEMADKMHVTGPKNMRTYSVAELFHLYCDFDLKPSTTFADMKALAEKLKVDISSAESIDDLFFLIFMEKIENLLPSEDLVFVEKYPPYQAALARLTPDGWGDRFEVYWKGLELANAFNELNDPHLQRQRAFEDLQKKKSSQKELVSLDEDFFGFLESGMPPSGGIALGVERLFMALKDIESISRLRVFPHSR